MEDKAVQKPPERPADVVLAMRLHCHRLIDALFGRINAPDWTGNVEIAFSVKDGRPQASSLFVATKRFGIHDPKES